jgi:hypothetical protein
MGHSLDGLDVVGREVELREVCQVLQVVDVSNVIVVEAESVQL